MGLIRYAMFGFLCFSLGYYTGGGCEDKNIESEVNKTQYTKSAYYQTVDRKVMDKINEPKGIEKNLSKKIDFDYNTF